MRKLEIFIWIALTAITYMVVRDDVIAKRFGLHSIPSPAVEAIVFNLLFYYGVKTAFPGGEARSWKYIPRGTKQYARAVYDAQSPRGFLTYVVVQNDRGSPTTYCFGMKIDHYLGGRQFVILDDGDSLLEVWQESKILAIRSSDLKRRKAFRLVPATWDPHVAKPSGSFTE